MHNDDNDLKKLFYQDTREKKIIGRSIKNKKGKRGFISNVHMPSTNEDTEPSEVRIFNINDLLASPEIKSMIIEKLSGEKIFASYSEAVDVVINNLSKGMIKVMSSLTDQLQGLRNELNIPRQEEESIQPQTEPKFKIVDVSEIRHKLRHYRTYHVPTEDIKLYLFQIAYELEYKWGKKLTSFILTNDFTEARRFIYGTKQIWSNWWDFLEDYKTWKAEVKRLGIKLIQ